MLLFLAGADVRIVDGHFAPGTGKPYAGKSTMIKTMVGNFGNFGMLNHFTLGFYHLYFYQCFMQTVE